MDVLDSRFNSAISTVLSDFSVPYSLKRGQLDAIRHLTHKRNVCAILPTGYGKTEFFDLFPYVMAQASVPFYVINLSALAKELYFLIGFVAD